MCIFYSQKLEIPDTPKDTILEGGMVQLLFKNSFRNKKLLNINKENWAYQDSLPWIKLRFLRPVP